MNATIDCPLDSVVAQSGNGTDLHHHDVMASKQELLCGKSGSNLDATSNLLFHEIDEADVKQSDENTFSGGPLANASGETLVNANGVLLNNNGHSLIVSEATVSHCSYGQNLSNSDMVTVIQKRNDEISDPIDSAKRDLKNTRYTLADITRMKGNNGPKLYQNHAQQPDTIHGYKDSKGEKQP